MQHDRINRLIITIIGLVLLCTAPTFADSLTYAEDGHTENIKILEINGDLIVVRNRYPWMNQKLQRQYLASKLDRITFSNGKTLLGQVTSYTDQSVCFENATGKITYPRRAIQSLDLGIDPDTQVMGDAPPAGFFSHVRQWLTPYFEPYFIK